MWKAAAGQKVNIKDQDVEDDEWETDPDFVNDVNEEQQRWGSSTVQGSGRTAGAIDMAQLRKETEAADAQKKKKQHDETNPGFGYGGKFGVETDRMDKSAMGHEYIAKVEKHASQMDYSTGFGGKYGIQTDRVDKSAVNWDHKEKVEKHASQKDYAAGFGGKFGVQSDRQDKSAVGWDHLEKVEKHESQKDYAKGFGGKFGVQSDRQDKSAVGWDHHEAPQKHESQTDHKIGFGGKFGLQTDRVDKSAANFDEPSKVGTNYTRTKPDIGGAKPSDLRAKFENLSSQMNKTPSSIPAPKKTITTKAAAFTNNTTNIDNTTKVTAEVAAPKRFDQSKMAFLTKEAEPIKKAPIVIEREAVVVETKAVVEKEAVTEKKAPSNNVESNTAAELEEAQRIIQQTQEELELINKLRDGNFEEEVPEINNEAQNSESIYGNVEILRQQAEQAVEQNVEEIYSDEIVDTGLTAVALYDYQAAADDEVSFDPDDIITHIEQIDEGWWRGLCKGVYGLFPANYVQLQ
ncbi:unnamed protein product [Brassicogethes aeneus]|uniref:SH3 domain-containing protein n=1 Tax=Brassicogethes aeneus TaxID=1431903 RepID=A0A9P0B3I1_BRAAE|nr:unnamed protein product [Brassicogethes aeneus]